MCKKSLVLSLMLFISNIATASDCVDALTDKREIHKLAKQFFDASTYGDVEQINFLLEQYPGLINIQDAFGNSPLILASTLGHHNVVLALLDYEPIYDEVHAHPLGNFDYFNTFSINFPQNVDVNIVDDYGRNAMMWASAMGYNHIVELFMKEGSTIMDTKDNNGMTALSLAAEAGHIEVVETLLQTLETDGLFKMLSSDVFQKLQASVKKDIEEKTVDINSKDYYGFTPLLWATYNNHPEVIKALIDNDASKKFSNILSGDEEVSFYELESLYNIPFLDVNLEDGKGYTALHWAAVLADYNTVKLLLDTHDVDVSDIDLDKIQHRDIEIFLDKHEYFDNFYKDIATAWNEKIINPYTIMVWANKFLSDNRYYDSDIYDLSL